MLEKIKELKEAAKARLEKSESRKTLTELKVRFLGKTGEVTGLLKGLKDVPKEQRAEVGSKGCSLPQGYVSACVQVGCAEGILVAHKAGSK